jgi:hypothetical protein
MLWKRWRRRFFRHDSAIVDLNVAAESAASGAAAFFRRDRDTSVPFMATESPTPVAAAGNTRDDRATATSRASALAGATTGPTDE